MEDLLFGLIGLAMIVGQVRGIVIIFGGHKNAPQGLKVCIGIAQILILLAVFGLSM